MVVLLRDVPYEHRVVGFDGGGWVTGLELHAATGIVYARTDVGGAYRSDDGGGNWTWLTGNIYAGEVWSTHGVASNQSDPTGMTVLLGIGYGRATNTSGVYKSTDGGRTFRHTLTGVCFNGFHAVRHSSSVLSIDEARPWRVWAATTQGVWRSEDGGETFSPVLGFNTMSPWFNASDSANAQAFVSLVPPAAGPGGPVDPALASHVVVGGQTFGLAFSADDGETWVKLLPAAMAETTTAAAAAAVAGPGAVLTSLPVPVTSPWRFHRMPNGTSFFATEGDPGVTLHGRRRGLRRAQADAATASSSPPYVFRVDAPVWADPSTWTFTDITPPPPAAQPLLGGCNLVDTPLGYDDILTVACSYGEAIYTSGDSGTTWTNLNSTLSYNLPCWWYPGDPLIPWGRNKIVVSRQNPSRWVLASGFGVIASDDGGHTWGQSSDGIAEVVVENCQSHPFLPNNTFCGVEDLAGFLIGDGGLSGRPVASAFAAAPYFWALDFGKGAAVWTNRTHVGPDGVLHPDLSFAGGAKEPVNGPGTWIVWPDPANVSSVASMTTIANMTGVLAGLADLEFVDLLQSPDDFDDVLLGVGRGFGYFAPWNSSMPLSEYTGGVVRSRDGGASWQHVAQQPQFGSNGNAWSEYRALVLDGGDVDTRWWGLASSGLYISRDRGEHWELTATQPVGEEGEGGSDAASSNNPNPIAVAPDASAASGGPGHAYVLTASTSGRALQHTSDYGATFTVVGSFGYPVAEDPYAPYPYIATHPSGRVAIIASALGDDPSAPHIYVSVDGCDTWTVVDRAEDGQYLGFGVAGLTWDAMDPTLLYVGTQGRSLTVVKMLGE
jgi:hypothetical protein